VSRMMWEDSRTDDSLPGYLWYWRGINMRPSKSILSLSGCVSKYSLKVPANGMGESGGSRNGSIVIIHASFRRTELA
jgi:hypothetical protein